MTIKKLTAIFERNKNRVFVIDSINGKEMTYGELEEYSLKLASVLDEYGVKKSDKIAIILPNCLEFVIIYFACMQVGGVAVPINPLLHPQEVEYILSHSDAKILFISSSNRMHFKSAIEKVPNMNILSFLPSNENVDEIATKNVNFRFFEKVERQALYQDVSFRNNLDEDTIVIIYTSGTTKRPKGVVISYKNVINNGFAFIDMMGLSSDLRFFSVLSMAYLGGLYNLMLIPFLCEGSIVFDRTFGPECAIHFWDRVIKYNVNALWMVPTIMFILLSLDRGDIGANYCKKNIKICIVGTAPLPLALKTRFEKKYSVVLYENYGLSETLFISTNAPDIPYKERSVGRLLNGCEAFIVDERGNLCGPNQKGEIVVKTPYLMKSYYRKDEETKQSIKNGRFSTGDVGYIDKDGYLFITDRKKDIIIRGGINISPREIEEVLHEYSGVGEVAVIGIPHEAYGEEIAAAIKLKADYRLKISEKDIRFYCKKHLASFKIPRYIFFLEEFPRSVTGKIQKNKLRLMLNSSKN